MRFYKVVLLLLVVSGAFAQGIATGTVIYDYNRPLSDGLVYNTRTELHTHTNSMGEFRLENCEIGDTIRFSFLGKETVSRVYLGSAFPTPITLSRAFINLDEITISDQVHVSKLITEIDIQYNPVNSSQDILRKVPGLVIGQHAGGGKAEQIFLRGFDLDHGTDILISVDGLPVNMVSHAHGQGYADLHFVIPETVDQIDFGKGPYKAQKGNFATAGYVDFSTKEFLKENVFKFERGQYDSYRMLSMLNLINEHDRSAYLATEFLSTDGYFVSPQNFNRINVLIKYTEKLNNHSRIGLLASFFSSEWDASGQIPQRTVDSGLITRFGSIDDQEGGATSRGNVLLSYDYIIDDNSSINSKVFLSQYDFELFSNFTFYLEDSINGDQIRQKEERLIYGTNTEYKHSFSIEGFKGTFTGGVELRTDQTTESDLSHTVNRTKLVEPFKFGDVTETNSAMYLTANLLWKNWTIIPAMRYDYLAFQYRDLLSSTYELKSNNGSVLSPKLSLLYNLGNDLQIFCKLGKGFHSNDTRVSVERENRVLPAAYGSDLGFTWKATERSLTNVVIWSLFSDQEFVYVGDAGIIELSGRSFRRGVEFGHRYEILRGLYWNVDVSTTRALSLDDANGQNYIPLAPSFIATSSLNVVTKKGFYGGLNFRYLSDRPANEDYSIVAEGYSILDFNAGYEWKQMELGVRIQNIFNTEWNETQFATLSRLQNELNPVEEIHFIPGTPFFVSGTLQFKF